ncbi:MAG TPA: chemotaxis protein CheB [Thermomicrobiales bacterium]|nr:chemotaxis protein CheB [Thermomicrobiales bacterium]
MDDFARSVVVIGASAGGIQPLVELVSTFPRDFPAAVLVVVHIGTGRSVLPRILSQAGSLPALHAVDNERIRAGHIYVAPPDYHLIVRDAHLGLSHGPKENHSRPAIDPLFRSAAQSFNTHTIGIVLSGALSDGTSGLLAIKARGGQTLVQDPGEASVTGMPESALRMQAADHVMRAREIGLALPSLLARAASDVVWTPTAPASGKGEPTAAASPAGTVISRDFSQQVDDRQHDRLTMFTCPDCGGSLWQIDGDGGLSFQCHVGHSWSPESLRGHKSEQLEAALWASVRLLAERATLTRQLAKRMRREGNDLGANDIDDQAVIDEEHAATLRAVLEKPQTTEDTT